MLCHSQANIQFFHLSRLTVLTKVTQDTVLKMEGKDTPPPYDLGFVNQMPGQPSANTQAPPISVQPQPVLHSTTSTSVTIGGSAGGCPVCHNRSWTGTYSCCAWLWCICCFPCGIICCLCMRKKKCSKCGFTLG